ncbi:MAG: DUF4189 domain-containing protein [Pseudomonadota bacterium]
MALADKDAAGIGWNVFRDQAQATAMKYCRESGGTSCRTVDVRQGTCLALAESQPQGIRVWEAQFNPEENSGDRAVDSCRRAGGTACKATLAGCSDGVSNSYISLAISSSNIHALGWGNSLADADAAALGSCSENKTPNCRIVQQAARTCIAVAGSKHDNILVTASSWNITQARAAAISDCRSAGGKTCSAFIDDCSDGYTPPPPPETGIWHVLPLIWTVVATLGALAFLVNMLIGVRIAPPPAPGAANPASVAWQLPVSFKTSRIKVGMFLAVAILIFVPCTELLLWAALSTAVGAEKWRPGLIVLGALGGPLLLWFTAKLLYIFGYPFFRPDRLTISESGILLESLGSSREWKWTDITDVLVRKGDRKGLSKRLVLSLREGVPGYTATRISSKMHAIWLSDIWATPSHFHSPEYLRDLIRAVWARANTQAK